MIAPMCCPGHPLQDLTNLNRPLTKVIVIDTDSKSVKFQPENSIVLDKWTGDILDRTLLDLVPFLQSESHTQDCPSRFCDNSWGEG